MVGFSNLPERYPEVIQSLRDAGCKNKATFEQISFHLTKVLHILRPPTITNHILLMCQFGYLRPIEGESNMFEIVKRD